MHNSTPLTCAIHHYGGLPSSVCLNPEDLDTQDSHDALRTHIDAVLVPAITVIHLRPTNSTPNYLYYHFSSLIHYDTYYYCDHRDDVHEFLIWPPYFSKRLCIVYSKTPQSKKIGEEFLLLNYWSVQGLDVWELFTGISEVGYGIRDTWVDQVEAVLEISPMTVGEVNTRVTELTELHERDTQDLYALQEDA
ncbi:hypothetical protein Tco_1369760 [Tanacetum coccineum]